MESNQEIRRDGRKLLEHITKKKVTADRVAAAINQFKDCIDYVTEREVKHSIENLHHKFIIHAEYEKARQFRTLVNRYIDMTRPEGLTHPTWLMLHLLFRLAYRPTDKNTDGVFAAVVEEDEAEVTDAEDPESSIDWPTYLMEDIEIPQVAKDDDGQSDWSLSDDPPSPPAVLSVSVPTIPRAGQQQQGFPLFPQPETPASIDPQLALKDLLQPRYWERVDVADKTWTEYQVLHELIWALESSDGLSLLFDISPLGRIRARAGIGTASLPPLSLCEHISQYCPLLESLRLINSFISAASLQHPHAYQAYAECLTSELSGLQDTLATFHERLNRMTTTLNDLHRAVSNWSLIIRHLAKVHREAQLNGASNEKRVTHLLTVLFTSAQHAQVTSYELLYPVLVRVLFATMTPMLNALDHWLSAGHLVDPFDELVFARNNNVSGRDARFWSDSVVLRTDALPPFLNAVAQHVMLAGRSVELLSLFGSVDGLVGDGGVEDHIVDMFRTRWSEFAIAERPGSILDQRPEPGSSPVHGSGSGMARIQFECDNDYLNRAFSLMMDLEGSSCTLGRSVAGALPTPSEFYPLLTVVERCLLEPIVRKERSVCAILLRVLNERCRLTEHLRVLRNVHLMRAGDLMHTFCSNLFRKMDSSVEWKSETSLTLSLLNAISSRMPGAAVSVSLLAGMSGLERVSIGYAAPWPVSLIITPQSLLQYNTVFRFLLKLKHALISLQRLSLKDMGGMDGAEGGEKLIGQVRRHRLQLLRAWLLHFTSSVDYYVMECVLECAHAKLDADLRAATHLGDVIECHDDYVRSIYTQCLQQSSAAFLQDALNQILSICGQVVRLWSRGISSAKLCQLEESYVTHHQYVASVLGSDAAQSMLPHVETLAAALIHSCPATEKKLIC